MNKIFKVIYSKTRHCYVVVSELAKSHCKTTQSHTVRSKTALTAAVLLALGAFSFVGMPVAQAADGTESMKNNDYVGANGYYWYFDEKTNQWEKYPYKISRINNNRSWQELPNYEGGGAKEPGAVTAGLYAQAGEQTVTIGNRNAGQSKGSVFIGELDGYNDGGKNDPVGMRNNYVTAVGFQSNATGWGSIAIGSNAVAENTKETSQVVYHEGSAGTSGTVQDDNYGIKLKPSIKWSSVALGYSAQAKDGNIAIGAYSEATDTSSATPYVSVGSSKLQRRITNVADGTGDTDVATVGQMNKAIESIGTTGWNLSTNGNSSSTTITSGKTVDFSPAVDGKNGTTDHKNVKISNDGSNVKIGLNKDIVLGEATEGEGGSLNVYSDSTEASNLGNRVSIDGSTVSVNYGKEDGTSGTKRGVVLGVGEDYNNNAQGYIAFNNIDAKGTIGSTYLHSATDAPNDLKGRLVYSNAIDGTEYIANLDDGITFTGDVQKDVPKDYTQTPTKLNTTLNITGGAATEKDLTEGNIGVVSTPAAESADGTTQASKLEIKLNKDLKGITSITSQSTTNSTGAKIELGANGTTISGGDVNVSEHKVTGLANGDVSTTSTDAITGQQLNAVKTDLTKDLTVNAGWGLEKEGNTISLERNLGKNYGNTYGGKGKVTFEADGENSLILGGGAINDSRGERDKAFTFGAHAKDSVLVGGMNNDIDENSERALIIGGTNNKTLSTNKVQQTGTDAIIVGGADNKAEGDGSVLIGGNRNEASGLYSMTVGGTVNKNEGELSSIFGGTKNNILKSDKSDPTGAAIFGGTGNTIEGESIAATIFGGENNIADHLLAVVVGGEANHSSGNASTILGGNGNIANGLISTVAGGQANIAIGNASMVTGGSGNLASGIYSYTAGGAYNRATGDVSSSLGGSNSSVNGMYSTGVAGGSTGKDAMFSLAAGYQSLVADSGIEKTDLSEDNPEDADELNKYSEALEAYGEGDKSKMESLSGYYKWDPDSSMGHAKVTHYDKFSTALGYQATANKPGTIAFGHDAGDESGYTYEWEQLPDGQVNLIDDTTNDYTKAPKSVKKKAPYTSAYYNRLSKSQTVLMTTMSSSWNS